MCEACIWTHEPSALLVGVRPRFAFSPIDVLSPCPASKVRVTHAADIEGNISGHDVPHPPSLHTRDVVNANCKACHAQTNINVASMDAKPYCVDCHRGVTHMRTRPISTRTVAYE